MVRVHSSEKVPDILPPKPIRRLSTMHAVTKSTVVWCMRLLMVVVEVAMVVVMEVVMVT